MSVFMVADTHFSHGGPGHRTGILKHTPRPWDTVEEMDEALICNWNNKVNRSDQVYIVGDFAWKNHSYFLSRLKGKKILIIGSHDHMSQEVANNFTEVHPCRMVSVNGQRIWLNHCAGRIWEQSHYGKTWHLFGHSHGRLQTWNMSFDIGVDVLDQTGVPKYAPWSFEEVKYKMDIRVQEMREMGRVLQEHGKELWRQDDVAYWINKFTGLLDQVETIGGNENDN
jgi:calcineurin-like phosphoesterase family protein